MAAIDNGDGERVRSGLAARIGSRLRALRSVLAAVAVVFFILTVVGALHWAYAFAGVLAVVAAVTLSPQPARAPRTLMANAVRRPGRTLDQRAALLIAALPDPCVVVDRRGIVVLHNEKARAAVPGLRSGDPLSFVLRAPDVTEAVQSALTTDAARTVPYHEKVPIERWFEAHVAPIRVDMSGPSLPDHVVITIHDNTNQQRIERMRVDFVANASHELRTPLASLSGFVETLQGPARNDPEARERFLDIMRGQALRMSRLIDDLLSLSRIELNAHIPPQDVIDLRSVVAQTVDALGPLARENGVEVAMSLPGGPQRIRADRDELYRVCDNLIENAIKYGASGKRVDIVVRSEAPVDGFPAAVVLIVTDRGPGIAAEHIPRLTERFYRVDTASSRQKGGTGLGLAIVKHILARHRGRLEVESRLGEGSVFTARFEALDTAAEGDRHRSVIHQS
jgi:two-component system phosphate regulon sensor histidine kinase PhoR